MRQLLWVVVALGVVTGQARWAHADTLTMGGMSVQPFSGGFAFAGATFQASGHFEANDFFSQCFPCAGHAHQSESRHRGWSLSRLRGARRRRRHVSLARDLRSTRDLWHGGHPIRRDREPFVLPPVGALPGLTMTLPFTITGSYSSGTGVFGSFSGGGTETITFDLYHGVTPPHWTMTSATWQVVAPTPEPSTVLLAGSGLVGLGAAAWTRRRPQGHSTGRRSRSHRLTPPVGRPPDARAR